MAQGNYKLISGNFSLSADDLLDQLPLQEVRLICDTTLVACNITLFASSAQGRFPQAKILVIDGSGNASVNNITIIATGPDTIDGGASQVINADNGMCKVEMFELGKWGTLFATTPGAALTPFLTNFVYVDAVNGIDISGLPYRIDRPFKTITAAEAAAVAGDTLYIFPGTYTDNGLGVDLLTYYFCAGATLNSTGNCFNDSTGGGAAIIRIQILGFGKFISSTIAFMFAAASHMDLVGTSIDFVSGAIDVNAAALINVVLTGDITSANALVGDGIIARTTGARVTAKFRDMIVGATGLVTDSPDDPDCTIEADCNNITTTGATASSYGINHMGGTIIVNCNKITKDQLGGGANAVTIDAAAGISGRLTINGDISSPIEGVTILLQSGLAEIYGNVYGATSNTGGGVIQVNNGLTHKIYGNVICATNAAAIQATGGVIYHEGRCVNTAVGANAGGYLANSSNKLIIASGNAIVISDAGALSVDDGGGGLDVQLYGEVVANKVAAGTVNFTISTVGLTVDVAVQ